MDNFENEEFLEEPRDNGAEPEQEKPYFPPFEPEDEEELFSQPDTQFRGHGGGRKVSPFADSPYVMNHGTEVSGGDTFYRETEPVLPDAGAVIRKRERKSRGVWRKILAAVLVAAVLAGSCGMTAWLVNIRWEAETSRMTQEFNTKLDQLQDQIDAAAQKQNQAVSVSPAATAGLTPGQVYSMNVHSVVLITCEVTTDIYGQTTTGTSSGSGFVLTENGYIVTNHHVVSGASRIRVSTYDGMGYEAALVGSDEVNDVAVLKVEAQGLTAVTVGSSSALAVGDQVVAIGNPLGELTSTMTAGYVSAMNRDVTTDGRTINMIQTDAAINSGNSGGPLFNMKGEVVGITTAKYSGSSASGASIEGIGFAIPMDDVIGMVEDLVNFGYVTGAYLGVMVSDMDAEAAAYYGMPVGAYVQEVTPGYCAERAGLQAKDIIVALGDYEVRNISGLTRALRNFKAGDTTTIRVYRGGKELMLTITLDEKPAAVQSQIPGSEENPMPQDGSYEEWYNYFAPFFGNGGKD